MVRPRTEHSHRHQSRRWRHGDDYRVTRLNPNMIMATLPFALIGGIWLLYLLGHNLSVAGVVGFIALAGVVGKTVDFEFMQADKGYVVTGVK